MREPSATRSELIRRSVINVHRLRKRCHYRAAACEGDGAEESDSQMKCAGIITSATALTSQQVARWLRYQASINPNLGIMHNTVDRIQGEKKHPPRTSLIIFSRPDEQPLLTWEAVFQLKYMDRRHGLALRGIWINWALQGNLLLYCSVTSSCCGRWGNRFSSKDGSRCFRRRIPSVPSRISCCRKLVTSHCSALILKWPSPPNAHSPIALISR